MLRQTVDDLELIVVDDASTDETPELLAGVRDPRLVVLRNDEQLGLAASLNRGLERRAGRYVARLDADDVAFPNGSSASSSGWRGPRARASSAPPCSISMPTAVPATLHVNPSGRIGVRWLTLFSSPFFHPTVLVDRERARSRIGLRYDPSFLESEDYDLWTRLLRLADGANLTEPLVLEAGAPGAGVAAARRRAASRFSARSRCARSARVAPASAAEQAELRARRSRRAAEIGACRRVPVAGFEGP